ncbi:MAG: 16S rRNA (uracil(1498)-N(3))-methyltransferase [Planctomicrobium sp.]|nr:16S rRNA (uracil(1498)-N(3))-methyltransferase [Planctomicrobium sp.]
MSDRFYIEAHWAETVTLAGSEAQHLAKVLRKKIGDVVELFDGRGQRAQATIEAISKRDVRLKLINEPTSTQPLIPNITLAVAPPKGDRFRWLIEKATELGVHKVIPIRTERSVVRPGETKLEKLRQTMIAACKQCGRDQFMEIDSVTEFGSLRDRADIPARKYFGAIPTPDIECSNHNSSESRQDALICIGPEGGFCSQEVEELLEWGAIPLSVSPHVLRVETAAIATVAHQVGNWSN